MLSALDVIMRQNDYYKALMQTFRRLQGVVQPSPIDAQTFADGILELGIFATHEEALPRTDIVAPRCLTQCI